MSFSTSKPENSLRRAQELLNIDQPDSALAILHDVIASRRNRSWSVTHEKIMIMYIDLCLSMNKSREAKDGLHQYRNLTQTLAPGSLENVVKYLITESEKKCQEAKELTKSGSENEDDVIAKVDLDEDEDAALDSTNMLLLSTMTADPEQSRKESALLLPRIKFLWESYRAALDVLKSNSKLEKLYHGIALRALKFCAEYKRSTEFRRLCDLLRMHLQNLQKFGGVSSMAKVEEGGKQSNKVRGWEGWSSDSIELHLRTRFAQLETASTLHLYTEGFRTVEDIFNILQISHSRRKVSGGSGAPKAKVMASYYEKLTTLFWVSENYLFHAFAWYKFYTLCKEHNKGLTDEEKSFQASAVLLSALCIPTLPDKIAAQSDDGSVKIKATIQDDIAKEKTARMATLLGFHTRNPTREALLSEIRAKNVMADVPDYLRDLYKLFEHESNPLVIVEQAKPLLDRLRQEVSTAAGNLSDYVEPLISVLLLKLMHSLSASYHTISLDHIKRLTSGLGVSFAQVEKAIISAATTKVTTPLRVRIDHRANCLRFGDASGYASIESDAMRSQLTTLSKQLSKVCEIINPSDSAATIASRKALFAEVRNSIDDEHAVMLARKDIVEQRKEEAERIAQEKLKEEERKRLEAIEAAKAEEERRLVREQQLREKEKQDKIKRELELTEKKNILKAMGQNIDTMTEEELMAIDAEKLAKEHADKAAKKKDDSERKVREVHKKLDYLVRATRIEEVALIKEQYEEKVKAEKERYEAEVGEKARQAKLQWAEDHKAKSDLLAFNVFSYMSAFESKVMSSRLEHHKILCAEEDKRAEIIAEKAKIQRARKRKEDAIRQAKAEAERLKKAEEDRLAEEERRRREEDRQMREAELEEARKKKLAEQEASRQPSEQPYSAPRSSALDSTSSSSNAKYVPPSKRGVDTSRENSGSSAAWGGRGESFGGGRYEGGGSRFGSSRPSDRAPEQRTSKWN